MAKEAKARIKINKLLEETGWRFFDDEKGRANILLENNVRITRKSLDNFGEDFENTTNGFIDFLLLDEKGFPLVVLEAKREDKGLVVEDAPSKTDKNRCESGKALKICYLSNGRGAGFKKVVSGNP